MSDLVNIPQHIAIVMDGNGRWASKRLLPHNAGHRAGAQNLRTLSEAVEKLGVAHLTVYALSTENWSRPEKEVQGLIKLMHEYFQQYIDDSKKNNMRMSFIGDISRFEPDLQQKIETLRTLTRNKTGLHVTLAINYGGRDELVRAARKLAQDAANGTVDPAHINEEALVRRLDGFPTPYPDLLIRTGGEKRISNFLLWQLAYAEMYFSDVLFPDFGVKDLQAALDWYGGRSRRFGGR
ncbi:MAG: polyprenyl diphosphate synthase [Defluviitaleaceae bacterium]|nr:polyprenyl diphosphate synthase [Defluviitaleaceae bacterium]MCL2274352.1 polyprenyl diphosphate synthase [Defluviitaleaceae bacterium]